MRCEELRDLLDLYLDGELPEPLLHRLDRHLLRCPACAYETRTLEQTRALLREALPPVEASPSFRERTAARLLDAFSDRMKPAQETRSTRQWELPFGQESQDRES